MNTVRFKRDKNGNTIDPLVNKLRATAKSESWAGMAGIKQWAKETYGATLRSGIHDDWTSISFKNVQGYEKFKQDFGLVQCD